MCSPVKQFFEIVRNFFQDLPGQSWSENRIPNKSDPDPDPKPDPIPSPKLSAACWSENRTIVRNLTRRQQLKQQPVQRRLLFPWLAAPEYRTIVTSYGYLDAVTGVSLEDLVKKRTIVRSRSPADPGSEQRKTPEACCNWGFYRTN